jgi:outer membrane PBP1 activator LpoA protein
VIVTPLDSGKGDEKSRPAGAVQAQPHIALLLPLSSRDFSRAAEVVRDGFLAAAAFQPDKSLQVKVYAVDDEGGALLAAYKEATAAGARCIVAGLTRDGAANIAASSVIDVPTLTLNQVDRAQIPSAPFYTLSLSLENDARQVARLIASQRLRRVAVLTGPSALSKRIRDAFDQEWGRLGGEFAKHTDISRDPADYTKLRASLQGADAIFIAAESSLIRQVRPYIIGAAPTFATSQVYDGKNSPGVNVDLQGIQFVDMPWMVEPSHPAVAVYPRSTKALSADLDRLYALGIDAYRLASVLAGKNAATPQLDGVTGKISLYDGHQFEREPSPAYFESGQVFPLNSMPQ